MQGREAAKRTLAPPLRNMYNAAAKNKKSVMRNSPGGRRHQIML